MEYRPKAENGRKKNGQTIENDPRPETGKKTAQKWKNRIMTPDPILFAFFGPFQAVGHFLLFGHFFPIFGFGPVFRSIPGGLTLNF